MISISNSYNIPVMSDLIPARRARVETKVLNSRFIATITPVFSVEEARHFISEIKSEFPDASHNVPAFIIGHGASIIAHCSDDGEPSGTAGQPVLNVLKGSGLGDAALVVTRYFGGTKLGTGGLVRAYSDSTRAVLANVHFARKIPAHTLRINLPYALFDRLSKTIDAHQGWIIQKEFTTEVTLIVKMPVKNYPGFHTEIGQTFHANLHLECISTEDEIIPITGGHP
jgi:uncharacterized YigZ family protein